MLNRLRDRVQLEVDSKLMTGFDVAVAAMLGAGVIRLSVHCHSLRWAVKWLVYVILIHALTA